MDHQRNDLVLSATRILLTIMLVLFCASTVALIAVGIALPLPISQQYIVDIGLAAGVSSWLYTARLAILLILTGTFLVSSAFFLQQLRRIINSVATGDPFQVENSRRLNRMALLTVIVTACGVLQPHITAWIDQLVLNSSRVHIYNYSFDGLLLALVLFILARVFRHGAAMREDLEGTV